MSLEHGFHSNIDTFPKRLPLSRSTVEMKMQSIIEDVGSMPPLFQKQFEEALALDTDRGIRLAHCIVDRWRFANLSPEEQHEEQLYHREAYEESLKNGIRLNLHPDDVADLVRPENVSKDEWLKQLSPFPPEGFESLA